MVPEPCGDWGNAWLEANPPSDLKSTTQFQMYTEWVKNQDEWVVGRQDFSPEMKLYCLYYSGVFQQCFNVSKSLVHEIIKRLDILPFRSRRTLGGA